MSKVEVVCKKCRQAMKRYDGVERIVRRKLGYPDTYGRSRCGESH